MARGASGAGGVEHREGQTLVLESEKRTNQLMATYAGEFERFFNDGREVRG
jgi:hypothetical protein